MAENFESGDKVYIKPEFAGNELGEKFTVSQLDEIRNRCWIGDKNGSGWYINLDDITKKNPVKR